MVGFSCRKLLEALSKVKQKDAYGEMLKIVTAEGQDHSKSSFNNDLVIEQNLERFKRQLDAENPADVAEFRGIYETRYHLPLSGFRLEGIEKEVGHE